MRILCVTQTSIEIKGLARDYVWNIEGLYFSLYEALGLFGLLLQFIVHILVYDFICLKNTNWD